MYRSLHNIDSYTLKYSTTTVTLDKLLLLYKHADDQQAYAQFYPTHLTAYQQVLAINNTTISFCQTFHLCSTNKNCSYNIDVGCTCSNKKCLKQMLPINRFY